MKSSRGLLLNPGMPSAVDQSALVRLLRNYTLFLISFRLNPFPKDFVPVVYHLHLAGGNNTVAAAK